MPLRVLHSADWHLGHRLHERDRKEEHDYFLSWLLQLIEEKQIDVLVVAGDVFDSAAPSVSAQEQYYRFLRKLSHSACRHVVIVAGNHDSPSFLEAPQGILKALDIHVVGKISEKKEKEILVLRNKAGEKELVVCAIPFLRDREIRRAVSGEGFAEIEQRLKAGIAKHYREIADLAAPYRAAGLPVLATGHLFASHGKASDTEKDIHVGNLGQVNMAQFAEDFDYIALGHLHRPQQAGAPHILYPGSPIPLSFTERDYKKIVNIAVFEQGKLHEIQEEKIPIARRLVRFSGEFSAVENQIQAYGKNASTEKFQPWIEVILQLNAPVPEAFPRLQKVAKEAGLMLLKLTPEYPRKVQAAEEYPEKMLHELTPEEVFVRKWTEQYGAESLSDEVLIQFRALVETEVSEDN